MKKNIEDAIKYLDLAKKEVSLHTEGLITDDTITKKEIYGIIEYASTVLNHLKNAHCTLLSLYAASTLDFEI